MSAPAVVIVLCGKRKSGKDYVADRLVELLTDKVCGVLRLSKPLKEQYAKDHALDLQRLLDASEYKEAYRKDMISWGEEVRQRDPAYFCRLASQDGGGKPVWLVTDARRPTDMEYFKRLYTCIAVRVTASDEVRAGRGWSFSPGVDDVASECALDDYACDVIIVNDGNPAGLTRALQDINDQVQRHVHMDRCMS